MTQREYVNFVEVNIKEVVNAVVENRYEKLLSITSLGDGQNNIDEFIEVLNTNLKDCSCGPLDGFNEKHIGFELDIDEDIEDDEIVDEDFLIDMRVIDYRLFSEGYETDMWFEFTFDFDYSGELFSTLNINI